MRLFVLLLTLFCASGGLGLDLNSLYKYLSNETSSSNADCDVQKAAFLQGLLQGEIWTLKSKQSCGTVIAKDFIILVLLYDHCFSLELCLSFLVMFIIVSKVASKRLVNKQNVVSLLLESKNTEKFYKNAILNKMTPKLHQRH